MSEMTYTLINQRGDNLMKAATVLCIYFTLGASSQMWGGEVVVGVPDGAPVSVSIDVGFDVEGLELISFDGQRLELIARSGLGAGRSVILTVGDGTVSLVVMGHGENGPTPPGPVIPPEDPVIPEGKWGFTRAAYDWFQTVDPEGDPDRVTHAHEMVANYVDVAAGLVSTPPRWSSVNDAFAILRSRNQEIVPPIGPVYDAWAVFIGRMSNKMDGDHWPFSFAEASAVLKAIGAGLEAVE